MTDFDEYIRQGEPDKKEKSLIWQTAIGLQQVDGLKPSAYLIETARQNIEGDITIDEVKSRIDAYYKMQTARTGAMNRVSTDDRTEEADKVSARITEILSEKTFSFTPLEYINIHRRLFWGIYKFAGKIRDYNITKKEWVLDGETVFYSDAEMISATLDYDFGQEKAFSYKKLSQQETVEHISKFVSDLWQIHAFGEGNTRTTAVFTIKYLRTFGFKVENDMFASNSWYFRNALVRANYNDHTKHVFATREYLMKFFGNMLFNENDELKNRYLHIHYDNLFPVHDTGNDTLNDKKLGANKNTPNTRGVNGDDILGVFQNKPGVKLNKNQIKMLDLIEENNKVTIVEMAKSLAISETAIENNIKKLREKNILSRTGADKTGSWIIKQEDAL